MANKWYNWDWRGNFAEMEMNKWWITAKTEVMRPRIITSILLLLHGQFHNQHSKPRCHHSLVIIKNTIINYCQNKGGTIFYLWRDSQIWLTFVFCWIIALSINQEIARLAVKYNAAVHWAALGASRLKLSVGPNFWYFLAAILLFIKNTFSGEYRPSSSFIHLLNEAVHTKNCSVSILNIGFSSILILSQSI